MERRVMVLGVGGRWRAHRVGGLGLLRGDEDIGTSRATCFVALLYQVVGDDYGETSGRDGTRTNETSNEKKKDLLDQT